jgi:hypothetical protein
MPIGASPVVKKIRVDICHATRAAPWAIERKHIVNLWADVMNGFNHLWIQKKTQVNLSLAVASWQTRCNSCRKVGLGLLHINRCQAMCKL